MSARSEWPGNQPSRMAGQPLRDDEPGHDTSICFVLPPDERYSSRTGGAIATVTRELARELLHMDESVTILAPDDGEPFYPVGTAVPLRCLGGQSLLSSLFNKARRRLRPAKWAGTQPYLRCVLAAVETVSPTTVVVANDPILADRLGRRSPKLKVVLWLHNLLVGEPGRALRVLPNNVSVVTVSSAVLDWTAAEYGLDPDRMLVIHNGVNLDEFSPRDGFLDRKENISVVCHGRIDPNKGQLLAACAVARVRSDGLPVTITIIGEAQTYGMSAGVVSQYSADLEKAMREANGDFTGRIPATDVAKKLREFDVACVLPLVPDPFPLAGLEAMAVGCAVIAVPLGGVAEMIGDDALCVEPTVEGVEGAIRALAADRRLLSEYKNRAARRSREFSWKNAADALRQLSHS